VSDLTQCIDWDAQVVHRAMSGTGIRSTASDACKRTTVSSDRDYLTSSSSSRPSSPARGEVVTKDVLDGPQRTDQCVEGADDRGLLDVGADDERARAMRVDMVRASWLSLFAALS
jgi:hypothetical protein